MQDSPKSPSKRGGARPGAGRKSSPDARNIRASFNLSPRAADALRRAAVAQSCSHAAQQRILREPHPRHRLPRLRPERNLRKQALDAIAVIDKADKDRKLNNLGIIIAICCGVGGLILSIISLIRADQSDSRMDELENRVTILESRATILERSGPPQK